MLIVLGMLAVRVIATIDYVKERSRSRIVPILDFIGLLLTITACFFDVIFGRCQKKNTELKH